MKEYRIYKDIGEIIPSNFIGIYYDKTSIPKETTITACKIFPQDSLALFL